MTPEQLSDVIALAVHTATAPLLTKIVALEARPYITQDLIDAIKENAADLRERVIAVERRAFIPGPVGPQGEQGLPGVDGKNGQDGLNGKDGRDGVDGKDGAPGLNGKDGRDGLDGKDGADGLNGKDGAAGLDGKDGAPGPAGLDGFNGKDGAPGLNGSPGLNGKDGRDGIDGKDGAVGLAGKDGAPGLDGVGVTSAVIDRTGQLVLTLADGRTKEVGLVVGKDGAPGLDGKDGAPGLNGKDGAPGLNGKDGAAGLNGKDALGFEDLDLVFNDGQGWLLRFSNSQQTKDFVIPLPWDAGPWQSGRVYHKGAGVMAKGCYWVALGTTTARPGDESPESRLWRLTVKCGRDGKPGRDGRNGAES